ncbi:MAG TPA: histidine kinase [Thermoleophilaceae bacterium]|nr:histidine kinase [Thermoleophilaceae bacterium]
MRRARLHSKGRALRRRAGGTALSSLRRALWGLGLAGFIFGVVDAVLILTSDHANLRGAVVVLGLVIGWGFIGVGLFTWARRPDNPLGSLMVATGFVWFVAGLSSTDVPALFSIGLFFGSVWVVTTMHTLLAVPHGTLARGDRRIVTAAYLLVTVGILPLFFFFDPASECDDCPENVFLIERNDSVVDIAGTAINLAGAFLVLLVLRSLVRRWRAATRAERRLYAPMYGAGVALMLALIGQLALQSAIGQSDALVAVSLLSMLPFALVPYLFLGALVRARYVQGGAVGALVARLAEAPAERNLRDALAEALDDPSLELHYWLPERRQFVDSDGRPVEPPEEGSGRALTTIEREGECIAGIVHDATLPEAQEHVRSVGAAAYLALENERLDAELRAKIDELRASRQRMLQIGLEERRRLERNLHDGAQQRLVSMALNIRLARAKLNDDPLAADQLLAGAGEELDAALAELRELARGIHPAVLSDRGLGTALETLASRAPVPVELAELPGERLPEAVELAAYFVVAEALTNVAKYANASHATVGVARENGRVLVEVSDDGVGGANPENGTGLRGLADRLAVLEGRLEVDSERGRGTTVRARIPCA